MSEEGGAWGYPECGKFFRTVRFTITTECKLDGDGVINATDRDLPVKLLTDFVEDAVRGHGEG
ncbi:hypothetical protein GO001_08025 [Streptomyces sp. NRRL B-1677]|uniref:hypothetical protein n=1 Tax=Streptomyces sp. NRRL B-1677 TaxID=2682966 RepID=UPI001892B911|nr:hypothetical protein [Streptomyces sp. NRRL B-1677]MBF6045170.1 hypothetical protein [Streptomyces sp. NRRL B-1677]